MTSCTLKDSAHVALAGLTVGALGAAAVTAASAQATARRWYALHPTGPTHVSYLHVFTTNVRVCSLALLGAPLLAAWPGIHRALDPLLALVLLVNAALVGGALSAYGTPLASRVITHALVELAAGAVSGAVYLRVRRTGQLSSADLAGATAIAVVLLAVGAFLEVDLTL